MVYKHGKIVLVVGASSGVGKRCAEYLLSEDYIVYGTSRKASYNQSNINNEDVKMIPLDVTKEDSIKEALNFIIEIEGRLDIVINCPGYGLAGAIEDTTIKEAIEIFNINFFGIMDVCNNVLPFMREQKNGLIINISSVAGFISLPFQSMYSASKYALESMTESLRMEVRPFGIKVSMISPGDMKTNFQRVYTKKTEKSVYKKMCEYAVDVMVNDEMNGSDPIVVIKELKKILGKKNPPIRKVVGMKYKLIGLLKRVLPSRVVEFFVRKTYME